MEQTTIKVKKYILTNDGEVIYCKNKEIGQTDWKDKLLYYSFRSLHSGGVNLHYFEKIIAQSDSLYLIIEHALKYYQENIDKLEHFMIVLGGILIGDKFKLGKETDPLITLEILMRARITEYMEGK